ncbi:uncharacterized protein [Miscanthus floridulus]|uniref:uncharacterized protein isoform X3 n=1 Tax=Miscanthus floridulus TaxID=154761 RepID=UPI003459E592
MGTGSDPLMPRARPTGLWHDRITSPSPRSPSPPRARSTSPLTTSRRRCSGPGTPRAASWSGCSTRGWPHGFSGSRSCPCSRLPTMRCGPGSSCGSPRCSPTSLRAAAPSLTGCSRASCGGPRRPRVPGRSRTWWLLESFSSMRSNGDQATVPLEEDESGTSEFLVLQKVTDFRGFLEIEHQSYRPYNRQREVLERDPSPLSFGGNLLCHESFVILFCWSSTNGSD